MKRVLVTGVNGLIGSHLARLLFDTGHTVIGIGRRKSSHPFLAEYHNGDLTDKDWIARTILRIRPDWIFHLAGCSSISSAHTRPVMAFDLNVAATAYLLDAVRQMTTAPRFILASSAEVYAHSQQALTEDSPIDPKSTYAFTKRSTEEMGSLYEKIYGIDVISLRFFYSIGGVNKNSTPPTIPSGLAYRLAECELKGSTLPLRVGVASNKKDFVDVRDLASACIAAAEHGKNGAVYNVCTGSVRSFEEIITTLTALSDASVDVIQDESFIRSWESPMILGSREKLTRDTGWQPHYDILADTLPNLLNYWREQLQA